MNSTNKSKIYKIRKGFTLIEMIVTMVISSILGSIIFVGIQNVIFASNRETIYRGVYSQMSEGLTKMQKIVFENSHSITANLGVITNSGSVLSFVKEDEFGLEKEYFVTLDTSCTTEEGEAGVRLTVNDGAGEVIRLTSCSTQTKYTISQRTTPVNTLLNDRIVNYEIIITDADGNNTFIKNTIFSK